MINVTEFFYDSLQHVLDNGTQYEVTEEPPPVIIFTNHSNFVNFIGNYTSLTTTTTTVTASTTTDEPNFSTYLQALPSDRVSLLVFLFLFSCATVFGNSLVILAVVRERYLHTSTNYFVTR